MADAANDEQVGEQNGGQFPAPAQETAPNEEEGPAKPGDSIFASKGKDDPAKIFVGGLNSCTTDESLRSYFSTFGEVQDVNVKYSQDKASNLRDPTNEGVRSRGFGFVLFKSSETAELVLSQEHTVDNKVIEVKKAMKLGQRKSKKLFVGGLKNNISDEVLNAYFSAFGKILETNIILNRQTQRRRGFAFILFEDESTVDTIAEVKFHELTDGTEKCRVEVKPMQPQMDRYNRGGFRGQGGFRGNHQGEYGRGDNYGNHGGGYQGDNQWRGYNGGGRGGYNQSGYNQQGGYYQGDQSNYNQQQYDQQYQGYQGYDYNYGQSYGQNQDGTSSAQYANGAGYQGSYQGGYDASSYGGQQYNYGSNYSQEPSNYGKAQGSGYQHNANPPY